VLWSDTTNRKYSEFRNRVNYQYKVLDQLDVRYGFETVPVTVSTEIKDGVLVASLQSYDSAMDISYNNGEGTKTYEKSVEINDPTKWAITFSKNGNTFKDTTFQQFIPHLANGIEPDLNVNFSKNYTAGGPSGLTDGKKGGNQFRDGNWQGYWGPDVEVLLDLGSEKEIQQLSSGFLQYNNAWIFFPPNVTYFYSTDGERFIKAGKVVNQDSPKNKEQKTQEYTLNFDQPVKARYVKLIAKNFGVCPDWHDAAGSKSWLFIDEFSVK